MRKCLVLVVLAACGGGGQSPLFDAGSGSEGDVGPCDRESIVEGELIDWDSSLASFQGVANATVTLTGDPSITTTTPPNGRLSLCARPDMPLHFEIDAPGDYLDGTLFIEREVLFFGQPISLRSLTAPRAALFFNELGLAFDPDRAQVVVLAAGDRVELSLDRTHATPQSGNDDDGDGVLTWTAGSAGRYVLFPNVDPSSGTATITGDPMAQHTVAVRPGELALVAFMFVFVGP